MRLIKTHNTEELSDQELLEKYRKTSDINFLSMLFNRHMHRVYGVCLKYLENREDSKDAVMQIFEILIKDTLKTKIENFKSWVGVVSKNYCLMQIRTNISKRNRLKKYHDENFMEYEQEFHPIEESNNEEVNVALKDCIEALKELQKSCIELFYFEQMCYKDIAAKLDVDEKKVKSHIQNGKRNLKICLEEKNIVYEAK
ncbi:MAG: sigma-70 family RNA polymerase sigma factor [Bacteroidales bacterium]|nr:sigma-70 family RNA polymerase sigma factor [Bacteroidales bacterium]